MKSLKRKFRQLLNGSPNRTAVKRRRDEHALRMENLETRQVMAADMLGVVRGHDYLLDTNKTSAHEIDVTFGQAGAAPVVGNWNGDLSGRDLPGYVLEGPDGLLHWHLDFDGKPGVDGVYRFGLPGDTPVVGDWNGDGRDDVGVVRRQPDGLLHWYLNTDAPSPNSPVHEIEYLFGLPGDLPVVGDWDGNGTDDVGVARKNADGLFHWFLNTDNDVFADQPEFSYGLVTDTPVVGDWDNDGKDNVGAIRLGGDGLLHWLLDTDRDTTHELDYGYGRPGDKPIVGVWRLPELNVDGVLSGEGTQVLIGISREIGGDPIDQSFTLRNNGTTELTIEKPTAPAGFEIVSLSRTKLAPGQTATLVVRLLTDVSGAKKGLISIPSTDGNENPFVFTVVGRVGLPEITVFDGATGAALRNGLATVELPSLLTTDAMPTRSFVIRNDGNASLDFTRDVGLPAGFELVNQLPANLPPGASAELIVRMKTATAGQFSGSLVIWNNDTNEAQFRIVLKGTVSLPQPNWSLIGGSGANANFGAAYLGAPAPQRIFIIQNVGNATLTVGNVALPAGFRMEDRGPTQLAPGEATSITLSMYTSAIGQFKGTLRVMTNAGEIGFEIKGTVAEAAITAPAPKAPKPAATKPEIVLTADGANELPTSGYSIALHSATAPRRILYVKNAGLATLTLSNLVVPRGFAVDGFPTSLAPGRTASFTVRLSGEVGEYSSRVLSFKTNDASESSFRINLSGRQLAPVATAPGEASRPTNGLFEIYANDPVAKIVVNPAYGSVPSNTFYVVDVYLANGRIDKAYINGSLTTLRFHLSPSTPIENNIGVRIEFLHNGVLTVLNPGTNDNW